MNETTNFVTDIYTTAQVKYGGESLKKFNDVMDLLGGQIGSFLVLSTVARLAGVIDNKEKPEESAKYDASVQEIFYRMKVLAMPQINTIKNDVLKNIALEKYDYVMGEIKKILKK